jgi:sugar phosphate isomerase/epimerase
MELSFYVNGPGSYAHVAPSRSLPIVAAAGFTAIDISASAGERTSGTGTFDPTERRSFMREVESARLAVAAVVTHVGLATSLSEGRPLDLIGAIDVATDVGSPLVTFHLGSIPEGADRDRLWNATIAAVREAALAARKSGVALAVDAVAPDFLTRSPSELVRFLEAVDRPELGWNFDPAFVESNGWDIASVVELLRAWIRHVHVKDYRGRYPAQDWLVPGDGVLDHARYVRCLRKIGFAGSLAAEVIALRRTDVTERWPIAYAVTRSFATMASAVNSTMEGSR